MIKFFCYEKQARGGGGVSLAVVKEWKINNRELAGLPAKLSREFFLENQSSKQVLLLKLGHKNLHTEY